MFDCTTAWEHRVFMRDHREGGALAAAAARCVRDVLGAASLSDASGAETRVDEYFPLDARRGLKCRGGSSSSADDAFELKTVTARDEASGTELLEKVVLVRTPRAWEGAPLSPETCAALDAALLAPAVPVTKRRRAASTTNDTLRAEVVELQVPHATPRWLTVCVEGSDGRRVAAAGGAVLSELRSSTPSLAEDIILVGSYAAWLCRVVAGRTPSASHASVTKRPSA